MGEGARRGVGSGLDRVTIQEAARRLGISEGAVRKRVTRGTLEHDKERDGRIYVYLDRGVQRVDDVQDTGVDPVSSSALISRLEDEIAYLREESRRKDEILMQQAVTMRQLTAAAQEEPTEDAQTVEEEPERAEPGVQAGQGDTGVPVPSGENSPQRRIAENVSENVAAGLIVSAIGAFGFWLWPTVVAVVVTIASIVVATITAINGQVILSGISSVLALIGTLVALYAMMQTGKAIRRKLEEADDALAEAVDEELMREADRELLRRDTGDPPDPPY